MRGSGPAARRGRERPRGLAIHDARARGVVHGRPRAGVRESSATRVVVRLGVVAQAAAGARSDEHACNYLGQIPSARVASVVSEPLHFLIVGGSDAPTGASVLEPEREDGSSLLSRLAAGTVIDGRYVVDAILGEGAMGVVVAARTCTWRARCAEVLALPAKVATTIPTRFRREAKVSGMLHNEHVTTRHRRGDVARPRALHGHGLPRGDRPSPPDQGGRPAAGPLVRSISWSRSASESPRRMPRGSCIAI